MINKRAIYIVFFIIIFFIVWSMRATFLYSIDESFSSNLSRTIYSTTVKTLIWCGLAFWFSYWIKKSSPIKYLGISVFPPLKKWVLYLVVTTLFLCTIVAYETISGSKQLSPLQLSSLITINGILFFIVSPLVEEILFRGLILKELMEFMQNTSANIVTSLLFVGIHLPFWISNGGFTQALLASCIGIFIFSFFAGWLYQKSASIWPSAIAHIANNLVASSLVALNT